MSTKYTTYVFTELTGSAYTAILQADDNQSIICCPPRNGTMKVRVADAARTAFEELLCEKGVACNSYTTEQEDA